MAPLPAVSVLLAWLLAWRVYAPTELGQDGFLSVDLGYASLPAMVAFTARDVHPPLYYALLHGWFGLFGLTYYGVKFVGVASGALAVVLLQRLGSRVLGVGVGTAGALLFALSPTLVHLAPTARDFAPGIAVSLLTLVLVDRLLAAEGRRTAVLTGGALAISTALALLTSYLHWAYLLGEALACGWDWLRLRQAMRRPALASDAVAASSGDRARPGQPVLALGALLAGSLLTLPWYTIFVPQLLSKVLGGTTGYVGSAQRPTFNAFREAALTAVTGWGAGAAASIALAAWCLVLLFGLRLFWAVQRSGKATGAAGVVDRRRMLLLILALGALEIAIVLWRWQLPKNLPSYLVAVLPVVALAQALALTGSARETRWLSAVLIAVVVAVQLAWFGSLARSTPIDWPHDAPLNYLATHVQPGDGLVFSDHARRAQYMLASNWNAAVGDHARTSWPPDGDGGCAYRVACAVVMTSDVTEGYLHSSAAEAAQTVTELAAHGRQIWYAESGEAPGVPLVGRQALASQAYLLWEAHQNDTDLQLYAVGAPDAQWRGTVLLGGAVRLRGAAFTGQAQPGDPVLVRLLWQDVRPLSASYTVFVHLDDAGGHLAAQQDGLPVTGLRLTTAWQPGETVDDRHGVQLPADLPPGDYRLNVGLYQGQQRLAMADGTNAIQIGVVHITR